MFGVCELMKALAARWYLGRTRGNRAEHRKRMSPITTPFALWVLSWMYFFSLQLIFLPLA